MADEKINRTESNLLLTAINRIVSTEVLEKSISEELPLTEELRDTNKVYYGKASILFVDMRESSKLPDKFSMEQLVKIYRSYIRTIVQAIRYSGGVVRDFMGDGILAVFVNNDKGKSEDKAVYAARYITTAIDMFLNPILEQTFNHRISCGIGIHTGNISLSKVGMRGKEQDDEAENEFGIAWIGNSTNLACKFSGAVDSGTIFISSTTYVELSDKTARQKWEQFEIRKGSNMLKGYIAKHFYLQLDDDIAPCTATSQSAPLSLTDELKVLYEKQLADIMEKSLELGKKEQSLRDKEQLLKTKEAEIRRKSEENQEQTEVLYSQEYQFHCDVLRSGHCKKEYVKVMEQNFWEDNLQEAIRAGAKIGKDEHEVKQAISFAMVDIYENLDIYDKAYDFLVEQAAGYAWLHLSTVQNIVRRVGYCDRLKSTLYTRLAKNDLSSEKKLDFEKIKNWLVFEYNK